MHQASRADVRAFLRKRLVSKSIPVFVCGLIGTTGTTTDVRANSPLLVKMEGYVSSETSKGAVFTEMLIVNQQTLLEELRADSPSDPVVNVVFTIERGASVLAFAPPQRLERYTNYLPLDVAISFSKEGVFMGKMELEVQFEDYSMLDTQSFWISHTSEGNKFISYLEYVEGREQELQATRTDAPQRNLPKVRGVKGPFECSEALGTAWHTRCQP
jgi:hypothetical protein